MKSEELDAAIALQMKGVVVLLEDHNLGEAESQMQSLAQQVTMTSSECVRERKLINLRQRLQSGIRHIQLVKPLTALIGFREALKSWLK